MCRATKFEALVGPRHHQKNAPVGPLIGHETEGPGGLWLPRGRPTSAMRPRRALSSPFSRCFFWALGIASKPKHALSCATPDPHPLLLLVFPRASGDAPMVSLRCTAADSKPRQLDRSSTEHRLLIRRMPVSTTLYMLNPCGEPGSIDGRNL